MTLILEKNNNVELPKGWIYAPLNEIVYPIKGKKPKNITSKKSSKVVPYINIQAFEKRIFDQFTDDDNCPRCVEEDVLLVWDGAREGLVGTGVLGVIGSTLTKLQHFLINPKYLYYYMQTQYGNLNKHPKGIGIPHINPDILWNLQFPLAPLNEQKRIVAKIEELFSYIDNTKQLLEKISLQLSQYKKSLLRDIFNGKLTHEWREKNSDIPTGLSIIEKSLKLREEIYKNSSKHMKKYHEPVKPKLADLPAIPHSWEWASFEQISEKVTVGYVGTMKKEYVDLGIPFLRSQNVRTNRVDSEDLKFITKDFHKKLSKSKLSSGDIVVVRSGNVGTSCVIPQDLPDANCSDVLIIKNPLAINSYFGTYYLNSIKDSRVQHEKVGIALTHFNTESLAKLAIPVPPKEEQQVIVKELERRFSFINEIETILDEIVGYHTNLKNKILEYAFQGKLVSQNPNDESSEVLLQKIKQEKEKLQGNQKINKVKSTKQRRIKNAK